MSLSSLFWLSAYVHVFFKVFEVWFAWRVVPSLEWTGGSLMLQGYKRSPFLQQKNWVQMLIADAKIRRAYIVLLWQILHCQFQGHCAYYSDKFCSANPKDIVHTTLTDPPVPIPRTYCILLLHPKDTVLTQILQCQSQRTLCIRLWQILQCQSQGHCAYANSPVPIPRTLCAHCSDKLWCQSQGLCAH